MTSFILLSADYRALQFVEQGNTNYTHSGLEAEGVLSLNCLAQQHMSSCNEGKASAIYFLSRCIHPMRSNQEVEVHHLGWTQRALCNYQFIVCWRSSTRGSCVVTRIGPTRVNLCRLQKRTATVLADLQFKSLLLQTVFKSKSNRKKQQKISS